jgi:voltage-gated potassium channel
VRASTRSFEVSSAYRRLKAATFAILDSSIRRTAAERFGKLFLAGLILLNVTAVILESVEAVRSKWSAEFAEFEAFSVVVFSIEYALRFWTCDIDQRYRGLKGRLRFVTSPAALIDLAAIVPAYLPGDVFLDLRFARVVRLIRMTRALKLARYSRSIQTFGAVFRERQSDLLLIMWLLLTLLIVASSAMYFAENAAQPALFSSIPASMWWATVTLTTVGYGDVFPVTPAGKFIGAIVALIGIGFFALPAAILASGFVDQRQARRREGLTPCPHCGQPMPSVADLAEGERR